MKIRTARCHELQIVTQAHHFVGELFGLDAAHNFERLATGADEVFSQ